MRKLSKYGCFNLLTVVHIYLLNFIVTLLAMLERRYDTIDLEYIYRLFLMPFALIFITYMTLIPPVIMMLVLISWFDKKMLHAYWSSLVLYLILTYFVFGEKMRVSCVVSTVITAALVTGMFWKTCKRLDEERSREKALES